MLKHMQLDKRIHINLCTQTCTQSHTHMNSREYGESTQWQNSTSSSSRNRNHTTITNHKSTISCTITREKHIHVYWQQDTLVNQRKALMIAKAATTILYVTRLWAKPNKTHTILKPSQSLTSRYQSLVLEVSSLSSPMFKCGWTLMLLFVVAGGDWTVAQTMMVHRTQHVNMKGNLNKQDNLFKERATPANGPSWSVV